MTSQAEPAPFVMVRRAGPSDVDVLVDGVTALLRELSGRPDRTTPAGAGAAARRLVDDPASGIALIAVGPDGEPLGLITASYQTAIRTGGRYAIVQELYVWPPARGHGIGETLMDHLLTALPDSVTDVEVGLPGDRFRGSSRTHAFYLRQQFADVGPRMRHSRTRRDHHEREPAGRRHD